MSGSLILFFCCSVVQCFPLTDELNHIDAGYSDDVLGLLPRRQTRLHHDTQDRGSSAKEASGSKSITPNSAFKECRVRFLILTKVSFVHSLVIQSANECHMSTKLICITCSTAIIWSTCSTAIIWSTCIYIISDVGHW